MTNPICVDLSHHNPTPDWAKLKAGGTLAVIMKATEGTTYVDPTYKQRRKDAEAAGIKVFTYHYLKHGSVVAQMDHYLDVVKPVVGERLVVDYEDQACVVADLEQAVVHLANAGRDYQITCYGAMFLTQAATGHSQKLGGTSLWAARYSSNEPNIATDVWPHWSLWQYTDHATVDGISAPVDGNKWNGDPAKFLDWVGPAAQGGQTPVPTDDDHTVELSIVTPPGIAVEVWINGQQAKVGQ